MTDFPFVPLRPPLSPANHMISPSPRHVIKNGWLTIHQLVAPEIRYTLLKCTKHNLLNESALIVRILPVKYHHDLGQRQSLVCVFVSV